MTLNEQIEKLIADKLGEGQWIQVSGDSNLLDYEGGFWCGFVKKKNINSIFKDESWEILDHQATPGFVIIGNDIVYESDGLSEYGFEALLYRREFYGMAEDYVELSQEFILLNNLRYEESSHKYYAMYDSGECEEAVRYKDSQTIEIKFKFIRQYISAKQLVFLLYFDFCKYYSVVDKNERPKTKKIINEGLFYTISSGYINSVTDKGCVRILGKKLYMPLQVEKCNYWPYEKPEEYPEYDILENQNGELYKFTSDPDQLDNYFGVNSDAPHYLTPIAFKKEVLQKYYDHPEKYKIQDGRLECGQLWSLPIDNHHEDYISAYLGDLGKRLPEGERLHWKEYNIIVDYPLSTTAFQRDFANIPVDSPNVDHQFQKTYAYLNKLWKSKYGWTLFIEDNEDVQECFNQVRSPLLNTSREFDDLVLCLVKILIDGLNEKNIKKHLKEVHDNLRGINALKQFFGENDFQGFEDHIKFLKKLYELRSGSGAHIKGKNYNKICKYFGLQGNNYTEVFNNLLGKANDFLIYVEGCICDIDEDQ